MSFCDLFVYYHNQKKVSESVKQFHLKLRGAFIIGLCFRSLISMEH